MPSLPLLAILRNSCSYLGTKRCLSYRMIQGMTWKLEPCTADDSQGIHKLLECTMYEDEPLTTTYDENTKAAWKRDVRALDILAEGHSIKAVTPEGRIVGAAINILCPYDIKNYEPTPKILDFLLHIENEMKLDCTGLLEGYMLAVDPDFRRQGMAKRLTQATIDHAQKSGLRGLKLSASSQYSFTVAVSLGFDTYYSIAYADYKDKNGVALFNPPAPHTHMNIMLKLFDK